MPCFAYIGCRTTRERNARGQGISVYHVDEPSGEWTLVQLLQLEPNPSFLAVHPRLPVLYAVHGDSDFISWHWIDPHSGRLRRAGEQSTGGRNPVHLAIDPTNRWLVIANYRTDSVAILPIDTDGALGPPSDVLELRGALGPHKVEQDYGRPHHVPFDPSGRFVVVPAKGFDRVFVFQFDVQRGKLLVTGHPVETRETAGPRHIAFHPTQPLAFVVNELDSTVTAYHFDSSTGNLQPLRILSSLPPEFTANSRASEIAISRGGRFLYASNRGADSITIFSVKSDGLLEHAGWAPSGGRTPRFFTPDPDERFLYAANEDSDSITQFEINPDTGALQPTDRVITTESPVCIVFRRTEAQSAR